MNYRPILVAIAVFSVFLLALSGILVVMSQSYDASTRTWTANETIENVTDGAVYQASPDHDVSSFQDDEVVTNGSGVRLHEGTDYAWNTTTGELTWQNTSAVENSTNATLTYGYSGHLEAASDIHNINREVATYLPWLLLLFAAFVVVMIFAVAASALLTDTNSVIGR